MVLIIPEAACGVILGKKGQRIRDIVSDSGANIKILTDEAIPGLPERKLSIQGNLVERNTATKMILDYMLENPIYYTYDIPGIEYPPELYNIPPVGRRERGGNNNNDYGYGRYEGMNNYYDSRSPPPPPPPPLMYQNNGYDSQQQYYNNNNRRGGNQYYPPSQQSITPPPPPPLPMQAPAPPPVTGTPLTLPKEIQLMLDSNITNEIINYVKVYFIIYVYYVIEI